MFTRDCLVSVKFDHIKHEILFHIDDFVGSALSNLYLSWPTSFADMLEEKLHSFASHLCLKFFDRPAFVSHVPRANYQEFRGSIRDVVFKSTITRTKNTDAPLAMKVVVSPELDALSLTSP